MLSVHRQERNETRSHGLSLAGVALVADMSGALYCPAERTLIVADLHLEKASAFARRGQLLPPYDTRETLQRLARVMDHYAPRRVVALGDSLHDRQAAERIDGDDLTVLRVLQDDHDWVWVVGNHDPVIAPRLGGRVVAEHSIGQLTLRHEPRPGPVTHEIAGHLHPAARLSLHGHVIRRPCFVGNRQRLIVPAFGAFTGGLNVLDPAFRPILGDTGLAVWMLGQEGIYPVATRLLRED